MSGRLSLMTSAIVSTAALQRVPATATGPVSGNSVPILMIFSWAATLLAALIAATSASALDHLEVMIFSGAIGSVPDVGHTVGRDASQRCYHAVAAHRTGQGAAGERL